MISKDYTLEIVLTQDQYQLLLNYQESYEKIFQKKISLENLFKLSIFFSNNINKSKIAILDGYDIDKPNKISDRTTIKNKTNNEQKKTTKGKIKSYSSPKGSNPELVKKNKQSSLRGFA